MKTVCIVGAGASGLCALKEFSELPDQFSCMAYEQNDVIGGTWVYDGKVSNCHPVHSAMYKNMKTNLPKEIMHFPGYLFPTDDNEKRQSFVHHSVVLEYLNNYAKDFELFKKIKFHSCVTTIIPKDPTCDWTPWLVTVVNSQSNIEETLEYDIVLICNGHYFVPFFADIPGLDSFPGSIVHSHKYREPFPYKNKRVLVIGDRASGVDISLEVCAVAKSVALSHKHQNDKSILGSPENFKMCRRVVKFDGRKAELETGDIFEVDDIIFATGYDIAFPFLDSTSGLSLHRRQIKPLFKHMINAVHPSMCIIGLPLIVLPFLEAFLQVKAYISVLLNPSLIADKQMILNDWQHEMEKRQARDMPPDALHLLENQRKRIYRMHHEDASKEGRKCTFIYPLTY